MAALAFSHSPSVGSPPVTTIAPADPVTQIRDAVAFARASRHHQDCRCAMFRKDGAGFCSDREALWQRAIDVLLTNITNR